MSDETTGPALAEALARLLGVDVEEVETHGRVASWMRGEHDEVTMQRRLDGSCVLRVWGLSSAALATGEGHTPEAARDDALRRLDEGYGRVRDVLDPWRDGPPEESGVYEIETESGDSRPGEWSFLGDTVAWLGVGRPQPWPTINGRPARFRRLRLGTPPERM